MPVEDRSSDLQARNAFLLAVASQSNRMDQCLVTTVVPAYRCGTVPDLHRIPLVNNARRLPRVNRGRNLYLLSCAGMRIIQAATLLLVCVSTACVNVDSPAAEQR